MKNITPAGDAARRRGFTLIELMVAVLVGSIVIAGVYMMYSTSTRGYRIQNHALDALGQLRMGLRQVKADLRAAGYNAPAQSNVEGWVLVPSGETLSAVAVEVDPAGPVALPADNQNVSPQRLRILGDFWSQRSYTVEQVAGNLVTLRWGADDGDEIEFGRIFRPQRLLRVESYGTARTEEVIEITAAAFNAGVSPSISLLNPITTITGFGTGAEASVLGYVRYRLLRDDRRSDLEIKYDLIREELDPTGEPVEGTALVVAEHVVDLQVYDFCMNTQTVEAGTMRQVPVVLQCFPTLAALGAAGRDLSTAPTNESHLLRSLTVKIASRATHEEAELLFAPRPTADEPIRAFELDPDMPGAARVYEMAGTVALLSVQARRQ